MEILVNQTPLDFELQDTISLPQVINHIEDWAGQNNYYVLDYTYTTTGTATTQNEKSIMSSDIAKLEIQVGDQGDLIEQNLIEVSTYIDKVGSFIADLVQNEKELPNDEIANIQEGFSWIQDVLQSVKKQIQIGASEEFNHALDNITSLELNVESMMPALQVLAVLRNHVLIWLKQYNFSKLSQADYEKLKNELQADIPKLHDSIEQIATNLTVGKEAEALIQLEGIVPFLSDVLAAINVEGKNEDICTELISVLNNLTTALDSNDSVTAADLVDYDLRDLLDKINEL